MRVQVLLGLALVGYAWVGSGLPSHSSAATVAVLVPAVAASVLALRSPEPDAGRPVDPSVRRSLVLWAGLVAVGLTWEAYAFVQQPGLTVAAPAHPTLSVLLDPVFEHRFVRFVGWLVWLELGRRMVTVVRR